MRRAVLRLRRPRFRRRRLLRVQTEGSVTMRHLIILLLGLILGSGGAIYFLGAPRAKLLPGARVQAPNPGGDAPGTAVITLDEKFFDEILGTIFRDLGPPSF